MSDPNSKITKKSGEPTQFELTVANTLIALESTNQDIKRELKFFTITGAYEFNQGDLNAIVINVNFRSYAIVRPAQPQIIAELEKKFKKPVVLIFTRTILPKYLKKKGQQSIPRSRTLTAVHDAILDDLLYPVSILGRRIRVRVDGSRYFRVLLDPKDRDSIEEKCDVLSAIYRKVCNKTVKFEFPANREFPV